VSSADSAPLDLVLLISGRGSNLLAIHEACQDGRLAARIVKVISDRPEAAGLEAAAARGLSTAMVPYREFAQRADFDAALMHQIDAATRQSSRRLIVLAGFMRILGAAFIERYTGQMLNIHPSLLPAYRGLDTHARALRDGAPLHGSSVHYVSLELDGGPVLAQVQVKTEPGDTPATLSARVQRGEHRLYWRVLQWVAERRLEWTAAGPRLDGRPLEQPVVWRLPDGVDAGGLLDVDPR
jgi:phosphoribosylglycinamide formyltransferase 1